MDRVSPFRKGGRFMSLRFLSTSSCGTFTQDSNGETITLFFVDLTFVIARVLRMSNCNLEGFAYCGVELVIKIPFHCAPRWCVFTSQIN